KKIVVRNYNYAKTTATVELWELHKEGLRQSQVLAEGKLSLGWDWRFQGSFADKTKFVMLWPEKDGNHPTSLRTWDLSSSPAKEEPALDLSSLPTPAGTEQFAWQILDGGRQLVEIVSEKENGKEVSKGQALFIDLATRKATKTVAVPLLHYYYPFLLSPDGNWLLVYSNSEIYGLYDLRQASAKEVFKAKLARSYLAVQAAFDSTCKQLAFIKSPGRPSDNDRILGDHSLHVLDLSNMKDKLLAAMPTWPDSNLCYAADGKSLAVGVRGRVDIWDLQSGKSNRSQMAGHDNSVLAAAFVGKGDSMLTAGVDCKLGLWKIDNGKAILADHGQNRGNILSLAHVPGTSLWATTSMRPGGASLWNVVGDKLTLKLELPVKVVDVGSSVASGDGKLLYCGFGDTNDEFDPEGKVKGPLRGVDIWHLTGGKAELKATLEQPKGGVQSVALSPDGKLLVAAGGMYRYFPKGEPKEIGEITAWDVSGKEPRKIANLEGHNLTVNRVIFSPDGKQLLSAGQDHDIGLWSVDGTDFKLNKVLDEHKHPIFDLSISADGNHLLSCDFSGKIILWDLKTRKVRHTWQFHDRICSVAFAPDGRHFITGNAWGTAYVFRLPEAKK
ncbi:MAG TPA: hypothetical protein VE988_28360, partial [Gemmataceae bacterium]|nr:hypothetical protein [Gemmataceae bacterium]